jgi:hypothetical protein
VERREAPERALLVERVLALDEPPSHGWPFGGAWRCAAASRGRVARAAASSSRAMPPATAAAVVRRRAPAPRGARRSSPGTSARPRRDRRVSTRQARHSDSRCVL